MINCFTILPVWAWWVLNKTEDLERRTVYCSRHMPEVKHLAVSTAISENGKIKAMRENRFRIEINETITITYKFILIIKCLYHVQTGVKVLCIYLLLAPPESVGGKLASFQFSTDELVRIRGAFSKTLIEVLPLCQVSKAIDKGHNVIPW